MHRRELIQISLLAAFITVTGAIKIPSIFPGSEFQLSAPIAVAICYAFGTKIYIIAGILSSLIGVLLGTQTVLNVIIAMVFRIVVAIVMLSVGRNKFSLIISGPIASAIARLSLSLLISKAAYALVIAAIPGMVYTAIFSLPIGLLLVRIKKGVRGAENVV